MDDIFVLRERRVRKDITDENIAQKAESMSRLGLINPITISQDGELIAGETRFLAAQKLGWTHIDVRFFEDLDELTKLSIELEENIKRTDLPWQDQCDALRRFHALQLAQNAEWRQQDTATAIGLSQNTVSMQLAVADEIASGNVRIANLPKYSTARELVKRTIERKKADVAASLLAVAHPNPKKPASPIIQADFHQWAPGYTSQPFNLLHIDFPYGINSDVGSAHKQFAAKSYGGYADTRETHLGLCQTLYDNRVKLMGESAHVYFWFSMHYYWETLEWLRHWLWVDPFPLIWAKTAGIIPNPSLNPRRAYETAFFCSWPKAEPRKIISSVANWYTSKIVREAEHTSEKNAEMLGHFFRMVVDGNTRLLDPTCGSGSALRAARDCGAGSVTGLELNPEYALLAQRAWEKADAV
jgi:ParB family chromosome partitioning protein